MADLIEIIQGTATTVEIAGPTGPQGPAGAAGASTGDVLTTAGDLLYRSSTAAARLGIGTTGQVLKVSGGLPVWAAEAGGGVTSVTGTAPIVSSGGTTPAISVSAATTSAAGSMSGADKTKLDGIAAGATANTASTATPSALGTAAAGSGTAYAREDHVHSAEPSDSAFRVVGSSDATKKVAFEVDGIDTATTRTLTIANRSGTNVVSDTSAGTGSDVVTNIVSLTTAEYAAIGSPDATTLYLITDPS